MTDFTSQSDCDDELLSGYLDDELSADERARVEARLAADAAARRLLDQLRAASQAVQGLPAKTVGYDLRDSILARAEQAMLASPTERGTATDPVRQRDSLPQFTIGRTLRGWIWASAALAAGLMIMFLQPGDERPDSLPAVASRSEERLARVATSDGTPRAELRSLDGPVATAEMPLSAGAVMDAARPTLAPADESALLANSEPARALQAAEALASPGAEGLIEERARDRFSGAERQLVESSPAASSGQMSDLAKSQPAERAASESLTARAAPANGDEFVIVHVVVKQAALENDAFDRLLTANGIQIEELPTSENESISTSNALADNDRLERSLDQKDLELQDAAAVLVEAPAAAIEACLSELKSDEEHYAGVSVDDRSARDVAPVDQASPDNSVPAKKLTTELGRKFNRGKVPSLQNRESARQIRYHFDEGGSSAEITGGGRGGGFGGGAAGEALTPEDASQRYSRLDFSEKTDADRGRAFRVRAWGMTDRRRQFVSAVELDRLVGGTAEPSSAIDAPATTAPKGGEARQKIKEQAAPTVNRLQVLFVLSPDDESAPSPVNENRAQ